MNTIYDGSFVLGQTSATNFVAGPGISIDSPSAGVVRIGNDETVLYSGVNIPQNTVLSLSEAVNNFEYVLFHYDRNNYIRSTTLFASADYNNTVGFSCPFLRYDAAQFSAGYLTENVFFNLSGNKVVPVGFREFVFIAGSANRTNGTADNKWPANSNITICGINRISGGNE